MKNNYKKYYQDHSYEDDYVDEDFKNLDKQAIRKIIEDLRQDLWLTRKDNDHKGYIIALLIIILAYIIYINFSNALF